MKRLDFQNSIKKIFALFLIGLSTFNPSIALAVDQPVSAPITTPVEIIINTAPRMVYPRDGQSLDLEGAYMFKVQSVAGARYLFGLFQDGQMIYENYRDDKTLSPNGEFVLSESNPAHAKFKAGPVKVMIRAMVNNKWSDAQTININLRPRQISLPTPTPNPTPIGIGTTAPVGIGTTAPIGIGTTNPIGIGNTASIQLAATKTAVITKPISPVRSTLAKLIQLYKSFIARYIGR